MQFCRSYQSFSMIAGIRIKNDLHPLSKLNLKTLLVIYTQEIKASKPLCPNKMGYSKEKVVRKLNWNLIPYLCSTKENFFLNSKRKYLGLSMQLGLVLPLILGKSAPSFFPHPKLINNFYLCYHVIFSNFQLWDLPSFSI